MYMDVVRGVYRNCIATDNGVFVITFIDNLFFFLADRHGKLAFRDVQR